MEPKQPSLEPDEIRRAVLTEMAGLTDSKSAFFYSIRGMGGRPYITSAIAIGSPDIHAWAEAFESAPLPETFSWDSITSFHEFEVQRASELPADFVEYAWKPVGIHASCGTNIQDGTTYVGWFGVYRRHDEPGFPDACSKAVKQRLPYFIQQLCLAREIEDALAGEGGAAVLDSSGNIIDCCEVLKPWIVQPDVGEALAQAIAMLRTSPEPKVTSGVAGSLFSLERVSTSVQFVVIVTPGERLQAATLAKLSLPHRQVACMVGEGRTVGEVADALARSKDAVRAQLNTVYGALGISSRAELAEVVAGWPGFRSDGQVNRA